MHLNGRGRLMQLFSGCISLIFARKEALADDLYIKQTLVNDLSSGLNDHRA